MIARNWLHWIGATAATACLALGGGCLDPDELEDILDEIDLEELEIRIGNEVNQFQERDPRDIDDLPVDLVESGDTIIINNNVTIVNNFEEDLIVEELPDITLLGFENDTGFDGYYEYFVDGDFQGILVFDGETLLLEYPCLADVELVGETYFEVDTGIEAESFDIVDGLFLNPEDFFCGEALIFTFDQDGIIAGVEAIDLLE
jgi:hypothetical protein